MHHPLVRNSARVRPEQTKFQILPCIERHRGPVDQKPFPIRVLFFQLIHQLRPPPAPGLVDVPCHFDAHNISKLPGLNKLFRALIIARAPPLRSDLHFAAGLPHGFAEFARIFHRVRHRFFHVGVQIIVDGFDPMLRMLKIRGGNNHRVHVFAVVQLIVVAAQRNVVPRALRYQRYAFVTAPLPKVRERRDFKLLSASVF